VAGQQARPHQLGIGGGRRTRSNSTPLCSRSLMRWPPPSPGEGGEKFEPSSATAAEAVAWRPRRWRRHARSGPVSSGRNPSVPSDVPIAAHRFLRLAAAAAGACRDVQSPAGHFLIAPEPDRSWPVWGEGGGCDPPGGLRSLAPAAGCKAMGNGKAADGGLGANPMERLASGHLVRLAASGQGCVSRRRQGRHWASQPLRVVKPGSRSDQPPFASCRGDPVRSGLNHPAACSTSTTPAVRMSQPREPAFQ